MPQNTLIHKKVQHKLIYFEVINEIILLPQMEFILAVGLKVSTKSDTKLPSNWVRRGEKRSVKGLSQRYQQGIFKT